MYLVSVTIFSLILQVAYENLCHRNACIFHSMWSMKTDMSREGLFIQQLCISSISLIINEPCKFHWYYYICAHFVKKFRLRLSYTCAHKSGAFALKFGVTLVRIFSQLFLGQLLVFEPLC